MPSSSSSDNPGFEPIKMVTAMSSRLDSIDAAIQICDRIKQQLDSPPDLLVVFVTFYHARRMGMIADILRDRLSARHMLGVTAAGVMSRAVEIEEAPAISVMACRFPGVQLNPYWIDHLSPRETIEERTAKLSDCIGANEDMKASLFFADPFSVPMVNLIPALSAARTQVINPSSGRVDHIGTILGGMASAGDRPNTNTLLLDGEIRNAGAMGMTLSGPIQVDTVVSQGCRPIGKPMVVTKARGNLILELAGQRAVDMVREIIHELDENDKVLLEDNGLMIGRVISEGKSHFGRGDFLIRSIMGGDDSSGAVAIADLIHPGQTVQLHLHDQLTAREDLSLLLDGQRLYSKPAGAMLMSYTGRGNGFFDEHAGDAHSITYAFEQTPDGANLAKSGKELDPNAGIPLCGFYASGEIGPIDGQVFHHGHSAVVGLFRSPEDPII